MAEGVPRRPSDDRSLPQPLHDLSLPRPRDSIRVVGLSGAEWEVEDATRELTAQGLKKELEGLAGVGAEEQVLLVRDRPLDDDASVREALSQARAQVVTVVRMPPAASIKSTLAGLRAATAELPAFSRELTLTVAAADDTPEQARGRAGGARGRAEDQMGGGQGPLAPLELPVGLQALTLRLVRDTAEGCLAALAAWRPRCLRELRVEVLEAGPVTVVVLAQWLGKLPYGLQLFRFGEPARSRDVHNVVAALPADYDLGPLLRSLPASLTSLRLDLLEPHSAAIRAADLAGLPAGLRSLHLYLQVDWTAEAVAFLPATLEELGCASYFCTEADFERFMLPFTGERRPPRLREFHLLTCYQQWAESRYGPSEEKLAAMFPPHVRTHLPWDNY